jgi:hypothetical protein
LLQKKSVEANLENASASGRFPDVAGQAILRREAAPAFTPYIESLRGNFHRRTVDEALRN